MPNTTFSWFYPAAGACGETGFGTRYIGVKKDLELILEAKLADMTIDNEKSMVIDIPKSFYKFFLAGDGLIETNLTYRKVNVRGTDHICVIDPADECKFVSAVVYSRSAWANDPEVGDDLVKAFDGDYVICVLLSTCWEKKAPMALTTWARNFAHGMNQRQMDVDVETLRGQCADSLAYSNHCMVAYRD